MECIICGDKVRTKVIKDGQVICKDGRACVAVVKAKASLKSLQLVSFNRWMGYRRGNANG